MPKQFSTHTLCSHKDAPNGHQLPVWKIRTTHPEGIEPVEEVKTAETWAFEFPDGVVMAVLRNQEQPPTAWQDMEVVEQFPDSQTVERATYNFKSHKVTLERIEGTPTGVEWTERKTSAPRPHLAEDSRSELQQKLRGLLQTPDWEVTVSNIPDRK